MNYRIVYGLYIYNLSRNHRVKLFYNDYQEILNFLNSQKHIIDFTCYKYVGTGVSNYIRKDITSSLKKDINR